ncbi:hypothetical protein [Phocaeicola sp.]
MDCILIIGDTPQIRKLFVRMMELKRYDVFLPDGNGVDQVATI